VRDDWESEVLKKESASRDTNVTKAEMGVRFESRESTCAMG
jgi:hypothetical protein